MATTHQQQQATGAFARTLPQTAARSLAATQPFLPSPPTAAAATSVFSPSASSSSGGSAPAASFLRSSFQIGSTRGGRTDFARDERVFHRSDVPAKAREAQEFVRQLLQTNVLPSKQHPPVWDVNTSSGVAIRGSKHCSWETPLDRFDNRFYHAIQSAHLVQRASQRVDAIRDGIDPDMDPADVNPRWNVSTFVEPERKGAASKSSVRPAGGVKHLPSDYKSLLQLQTSLNLDNRHRKATAATLQAETDALEASWAAWKRAEHVQGSPTQPPLPAEKRDTDQIARAVAEQYPSEALQTFLWQQENPEAAAKAGLSPLAAAGPAHSSSHALKSTLHHAHRTQAPASYETLPYSSKVPPAWYRVEAKAQQVAQSRAEAPFPRFAHPGQYAWVEASTDGLGASAHGRRGPLAESKEWTGTDEVTAAGGTYQWSCCLHPLRDARGCTALDTDPQKRRIVVARSDDPSSTAARGLASTRIHTSATGRGPVALDASHVRARSEAAQAAVHGHAAPVTGGTSGVTAFSATGCSTPSGLGLSGPGVAIVKRYAHTGRFELMPATDERMWSCCGAERKEAQGCTAKVITQEHRWQVDSV